MIIIAVRVSARFLNPLQTINKVFEHAGDLVNIKVAHDLMRLIAEGFREDGDTVDSELRSSAVCDFVSTLVFCLLKCYHSHRQSGTV